MLIKLPKRLTYKSWKETVLTYSPDSLYINNSTQANNICEFDWTNVLSANLPEIISILNWSTILVQKSQKVIWRFYDTKKQSLEAQELALLAQQVLGNNNFEYIAKQIESLRKEAKFLTLTTKKSEKVFNQLKIFAENTQTEISLSVEQWLKAEEEPFHYMKLLTYLDRYKIFDRAFENNISIQPTPGYLPRYSVLRASETASLELRTIHKEIDVLMLVEKLSDTNELTNILGKYAKLNMAVGGTLAQILVNELGHNVSEHADAGAAWLCTRIVEKEKINLLTEDDPSYESFRRNKTGFLEIIICDNGKGLISELGPILQNDKRSSVINKYQIIESTGFSDEHLIDYAFDRLASSKRDRRTILLIKDSKIKNTSIASGLYWVWNVIRSHKGVLSIHTSDLLGWYDFTNVSNEINPVEWELKHLVSDTEKVPFKGTMVRVCLPLKEQKDYKTILKPSLNLVDSIPISKRASETKTKIKIVWIGDITESIIPELDQQNNYFESQIEETLLPGFISNQENLQQDYDTLLLEKLQTYHNTLADGDILVVDLSGLRINWATKSIESLCHFLLEMNYTSTTGRSTVVFYNVPKKLEEVFETIIGDIALTYSHIESFRRASILVYDDGKMRLFCGWGAAEKILETLRYQSDLDFDELNTEYLTDQEIDQLRLFITENPHILKWIGNNRVQFRAWPLDLREKCWSEGILWLNKIIDLEVKDGGIKLIPQKDRTKKTHSEAMYFRLANDMCVDTFYQFRGALSNYEICSRISWHVVQIIASIVKKHMVSDQDKVILVTVSRSTDLLIKHIFENYLRTFEGVEFTVVAESRIEDLELIGSQHSGKAILITDVISSGVLGKRIIRAMPDVTWLNVITLLDTRIDAFNDINNKSYAKLDLGIEAYNTNAILDIPVYSLAFRKVEKFSSEKIVLKPVEAIDGINVSPVKLRAKQHLAEGNFWDYIERKRSALFAGHFYGDYHHYIYQVNVDELLDAPNSTSSNENLLDFITDMVDNEIKNVEKNPNKLVIMHPPSGSSSAEKIAKAVQMKTDALYRHVLYKDKFAGHWQFSPFVNHGLPLDGNTLLLFDDGTNTGETLVGLLDAASESNPNNIFAFVGITRMLPHKNSVFHGIESLKNVNSIVKVKFALQLNIPVFIASNCPICKLRSEVYRISTMSRLLRRYCEILRDQLKGVESPPKDFEKASFLWKYSNSYQVTKLREAFEEKDYNINSYDYVKTIIKRAIDNEVPTDDNNPLLELAFVICIETEISTDSILFNHLESLIEIVFKTLNSCPENEIFTYLGLSYHLTLQLRLKMDRKDWDDQTPIPWKNLLNRIPQISVDLLGVIVTFIMIDAINDKEIDSEQNRTHLCQMWLKSLDESIKELSLDELMKGFAFIFSREALSLLLTGSQFISLSLKEDKEDFYDLVDRTASSFWWHAASGVEEHILKLKESIEPLRILPTEEFRIQVAKLNETVFIDKLVLGFKDLFDLQKTLSEIELFSRKKLGERPDGDFRWDSERLRNVISAFVERLLRIERIMDEHKVGKDELFEVIDTISSNWSVLFELLKQAFGNILPIVDKVIFRQWRDFKIITKLPEFVAGKIEIDESLQESERRVFIPEFLLARFLKIAIQNLETSVFTKWSEQQIQEFAKAHIRIFPDKLRNGSPAICIRIVDTGPIINLAQVENTFGQHNGLNDVESMAAFYGAELRKPSRHGNETWVDLVIRHRRKEKE